MASSVINPITNGDVIQWLKREDIAVIPKYKLWPLFAIEFNLEISRVIDKTFAESIKRLEKEFKHYGEKKNDKDLKSERLANVYLIPYKKEQCIPSIEEYKNIKSEHTEKYKECESLRRNVEVMEINTVDFKEQISELTYIRKSLSDLIKSKAIVESELLELKDDYDVIQKSRSDEQAVSAKNIKEMEDKVSESAKEKRNLNKTLKGKSETIEKLKLKFNKSKLTSTKTEKELNKDLESLQKNLCKKSSV